MWVFRSSNPITRLWKNKDAWCREFFPQYADLFGGYPKPLKIIYGDGRVTRPVTPIDMKPWAYPGQAMRPNGKKFIATGGTNRNGRPAGKWIDATEAEFVQWCESICFFRNGALAPTGGPGLDPGLLVGGADYRGRHWRVRRKERRSLKNANKIRKRNGERPEPILQPGYLTCGTGNYFYAEGPVPSNPWGVNACFIAFRHKEPLYIQQLWGPEHLPARGYLGKTYWTEDSGPVPSQEEYDRARWEPRLKI